MKKAQTTIKTPAEARRVLEPSYWLPNFLGVKLWKKQREIAEAVKEHRHVAVRSCHSAGKSFSAGGIAIWFTYAHKPVRVLTTAPTDRQVKGVLWKEINIRWKAARVDLAGRCLTQELHVSDDRFALGFTTSKSEKTGGSRFQGWHARNILVIIDEASGVEPDIYAEISGVLSNDNAHLLEIGNPTNPLGEFAASFKDPNVHKIKISAFDTPNFTEFGITQEDIEADTWQDKITGQLPYPELITPEWVAERYRKWGKDSPLYQSRVLAEFPTAGEDTLIPLYMVEAAMHRTIKPDPRPHLISVDVARYGSNMTVIMHRKGSVHRTLKRIAKGDTMETAGVVQRALEETGADYAVVDVVGVGAGVVDRLREQGCRVVAANGGEAARDTTRFVNARAEWYWTLREDFENGIVDLDTKDEELLEQLPDIKWKVDSRGRIQIESKDDMAKRGVHSPDDADALAMTRCLGTGVPVIEAREDSERHLYRRPEKQARPRWY